MSRNADANQRVIISRFNSLIFALETKIEEMATINLFGVWKHLPPEVFRGFLTAIKSDVQNKILTLRNDVKFEWLIAINDKLEEILSYADNITNSILRNGALHEFVSHILRDLKLNNEIPYVICDGGSLGTIPLIEDWEKAFSKKIVFFPEVNKFIQEFRKRHRDLSIIFIPPVILQEKQYWVLIGHEIGHIINVYKSLVTEFNQEVPEKKANLPEGENFFHGREYVSDFIGNAYFGPIFYDLLHTYLLTIKPYVGGTHPPWDARLFFLEEELGDVNTKKTITASTKNYKSIKDIEKILEKTRNEVFKEVESYYHEDKTESNKAIDNLKNIIPYIGSPRILLNSYHERRKEVDDTIKAKIKKRSVLPENIINALIEDSVRLKNMKTTFDLMAKIEHEKEEASKT